MQKMLRRSNPVAKIFCNAAIIASKMSLSLTEPCRFAHHSIKTDALPRPSRPEARSDDR
ncbi:hypothetical protein [Rhodovulum steppense]|uniref:hypothetical protein n=1 Tax=Rhodovulum steppense TaxID=540251 RepID=UPI0014049FAA|nr:hypothetical protein [Rhodovulum steppense]